MEWNLRPSSLWEWDNLFELDGKPSENPKKLQEQRPPDYFVESDRGISSGSLHSPGDGGGSGSGSDFGHASSKSSVSASINSSSIGESKATANKKFTLDGFEPFQRDPRSEKQFGTSPTPDVSAGSGEPLLSLKLGKRMYFKDIGSETNAAAAASKMTPSPPAVSMSSSGTTTTVAKRSKSSSQIAIAPRCQVEGCNLDLSSAKDYHRKHRICENHSKSPRVVVSGVERRFCQQCSRFHGLSEFDEKKRSCRRRLSDHNARRRKPQPEAVRLNPARFSSLYDEPQQKMSLVFDQAPRLFTRHSSNFAWGYGNGGGDGSKLGNTREYLSRPAKTVLLPNNNNNDVVPANIAMLYPHDSSRLKTTAAGSEFLHSGLEESVVSSELNTTTQDLHRALSLLSTSSWGGSRETTKPVVVTTHHDDLLLNNTIQPPLHPINHGGALTTSATTPPLASADFWQTAIETEPPPSAAATNPPIHNRGPTSTTTSHFQDLHLFKAPSESGFYSYHFN